MNGSDVAIVKPQVAVATASGPAAQAKRDAGETISKRHITIALVFIGAHVLLALVMNQFAILATVHALVTLALALVYTATTRNIRHVAAIVAYIIGCEVLWRMTKVGLFWEYGKYATLSIFLIALARIKWRRNRYLALLYFAFLIPSIGITLVTLSPSVARQEISFNLSGPLVITAAVLFFSNVRITAAHLRIAFFAMIAPVTGIGAICYLSTTSSSLEFLNMSNAITSGGFGPNQVSAVLGLATMFLLFLTFERRMSWRLRLPLLTLAAAIAAQAVLTFSRGGIALALAGTCVSLFFLVRRSVRGRMTIVVIGVLSFVIGRFVIEPQLDDVTGGKLSKRYSSTKTSGRDEFIASELAMFSENPLFGVGPGVGGKYRVDHDLHLGASHTEYTRMLGEHGLFGVFSLLCLLTLGVRAIRGSREPSARALAAGMVVWAALFLAIYGTRIAAPAIVFGLAFSIRTAIVAKRYG